MALTVTKKSTPMLLYFLGLSPTENNGKLMFLRLSWKTVEEDKGSVGWVSSSQFCLVSTNIWSDRH